MAVLSLPQKIFVIKSYYQTEDVQNVLESLETTYKLKINSDENISTIRMIIQVSPGHSILVGCPSACNLVNIASIYSPI